jgi:hypothetical protein
LEEDHHSLFGQEVPQYLSYQTRNFRRNEGLRDGAMISDRCAR